MIGCYSTQAKVKCLCSAAFFDDVAKTSRLCVSVLKGSEILFKG